MNNVIKVDTRCFVFKEWRFCELGPVWIQTVRVSDLFEGHHMLRPSIEKTICLWHICAFLGELMA